MTQPNDLLTTADAARTLGVAERTMIKWRNERCGPPWCKVGKLVRYRRHSLDKWLESRETNPVREAV